MSDATVTPPRAGRVFPAGHYVEWSAIIAGGLMAAAISFVLLTFGTAIGLSATSPWQSESGLGAKGIASLAAFWAIAQQIAAVMAGAYLAGRMRARWGEMDEDEVDFRDGVHGGLVWALGVILSSYLAMSAAGSVAKTATDAVSKLAGTATANADPVSYQVGTLLRPGGQASAQAAGGQGAEQTADLRNDLMTVFGRSLANGTLTQEDKNYVVGVVAQRAGVPREEA